MPLRNLRCCFMVSHGEIFWFCFHYGMVKPADLYKNDRVPGCWYRSGFPDPHHLEKCER